MDRANGRIVNNNLADYLVAPTKRRHSRHRGDLGRFPKLHSRARRQGCGGIGTSVGEWQPRLQAVFTRQARGCGIDDHAEKLS